MNPLLIKGLIMAAATAATFLPWKRILFGESKHAIHHNGKRSTDSDNSRKSTANAATATRRKGSVKNETHKRSNTINTSSADVRDHKSSDDSGSKLQSAKTDSKAESVKKAETKTDGSKDDNTSKSDNNNNDNTSKSSKDSGSKKEK